MKHTQGYKNDPFRRGNEFKQLHKRANRAGGIQEVESKARVHEAITNVEQVVGAVAQGFIGAFAEKKFLSVPVQVLAHDQHGQEAKAEVNDIGEDLIHNYRMMSKTRPG